MKPAITIALLLLAGCKPAPVSKPAPVETEPAVTREDFERLERQIAALPKPPDLNPVTEDVIALQKQVEVILTDMAVQEIKAEKAKVRREPAPHRDESPAVRSPRLLYFGKPGCSGCLEGVKLIDTLPASWTRDTGPENHIQFIDTKERSDLAEKYRVEVTPTWVLVDGWNEIGRVDPDVEGWDVRRFVRQGLDLYRTQFSEDAP